MTLHEHRSELRRKRTHKATNNFLDTFFSTRCTRRQKELRQKCVWHIRSAFSKWAYPQSVQLVRGLIFNLHFVDLPRLGNFGQKNIRKRMPFRFAQTAGRVAFNCRMIDPPQFTVCRRSHPQELRHDHHTAFPAYIFRCCGFCWLDSPRRAASPRVVLMLSSLQQTPPSSSERPFRDWNCRQGIIFA